MNTPNLNSCTSIRDKNSHKQSSVNKTPNYFKCSKKGKSKLKSVKSQIKDTICQTSSSSFVCEYVKEENNQSESGQNNTLLDLDSKPITQEPSSVNHRKIGKQNRIRPRRNRIDYTNLPAKFVGTNKVTENYADLLTANQNVTTTCMKPAIIKMSKESDTCISKIRTGLDDSIEKVLGIGSSVETSNFGHKSNGNEKIDFLLNIIKSPPFIDKTDIDWKPPNLSEKHLSITLKDTYTITDQSSPSTGELEIEKQIQNKLSLADFLVRQKLNSQGFIKTTDDVGLQSERKIFELSGSKFLFVMKPESICYLVGITEIQVICGSVEILGYNMDESKPKQIIYSLQGSSHLYVRASGTRKTNCEYSSENSISKILSSHGVEHEISKQILRETKAKTMFLLTRIQSHTSATVWPNLFECHCSFPLFPPQDTLDDVTREQHSVEYGLDCILDQSLKGLGLKEFYANPEWPEIAEGIATQDQPRTVLCGGKSVGKSSLLRYFVNKCLSKWDEVIVIDFDPGQCEFTLPGCISVTLVNKPLLGPNYTHLTEPSRSVYLGEVDVTKCPEPYIDGCKLLIDFARQQFDHLPWFVNTMGFTRGFGVTVACGIISAVNPTHVVQIDSKDRKLNFPANLEPGFIYRQNISSFKRQNSSLNYRLHSIQSGSELSTSRFNAKNSRSMSPAEKRNFVILSYLSEMLSSEISNLSQVIPHMVNLSDLTLLTTSQCSLTKNQVAMSMNGNMVALCSLEDHFPNCLGFGIVRAIDWQTNTVYIITPMPADSLCKVNCLIKGSVSLPESLYLNQGEHIVGHVPFTALTSGQATSRFAKRDFRSLPSTPRAAARETY